VGLWPRINLSIGLSPIFNALAYNETFAQSERNAEKNPYLQLAAVYGKNIKSFFQPPQTP
jgi:hypothetical protein